MNFLIHRVWDFFLFGSHKTLLASLVKDFLFCEGSNGWSRLHDNVWFKLKPVAFYKYK